MYIVPHNVARQCLFVCVVMQSSSFEGGGASLPNIYISPTKRLGYNNIIMQLASQPPLILFPRYIPPWPPEFFPRLMYQYSQVGAVNY